MLDQTSVPMVPPARGVGLPYLPTRRDAGRRSLRRLSRNRTTIGENEMGSAPQAPKQDGSRFIVDLGSVKLPAILEKQVETDIRAVVLAALGESDIAVARRLPDSIFDRFPGRTLGLWLDPDVQFPEPWGPLIPEDHTNIVRAVLTHPFQVLRYLDAKSRTDKPSGEEVLEAALQVEQIDDYTKERIRAVLDILPKLEEAREAAPRSLQQEYRSLERSLEQAPGVEGKLRLLKDPGARSAKDDDGHFSAGLDLAARILEGGASSIYSPAVAYTHLRAHETL
ncbi:hypothetical protein, partial [Streptomyces sp. MZ04]|uniref:hypothetical protein n=1 Tax=Streptomyces sp. MZ04 TaxID=2559236 RepID=UPI00107E67EF